jgi:allantoate deiminase
MGAYDDAAREAIARCQWIAGRTEHPGQITRTFLSPSMREVHEYLREWMEECGMRVSVDNAGNQRGVYGEGPRLVIGSHLDTVPNAGAYDGVLGVVLGIALVQLLARRRIPFQIEVIGFSEEEGVRFGVPFIGSRAFVGDAEAMLPLRDREGVTVSDALRAYGLDPARIADAETEAAGYLEFHIEQGPVLESLGLPVSVVDAIAGQSRWDVTFTGHANHAGTTPMALRRDALTCAAEWICAVERVALAAPGLVATVGRIEASPNARNVINGRTVVSLDVRHARDSVRVAVVDALLREAAEIAARRGLVVVPQLNLDQAAVPMALCDAVAEAVAATGRAVHRMTSGAGHDAMVVARRIPAGMVFLRSPGGVSHHPSEDVLVDDVAVALEVGMEFLHRWGSRVGI